jgi:hypothetical protein
MTTSPVRTAKTKWYQGSGTFRIAHRPFTNVRTLHKFRSVVRYDEPGGGAHVLGNVC